MDYYGGGEVCGPLRLNGRRIVTWNMDHHYNEQSQSLYESHPYILAVGASLVESLDNGLDPIGKSYGIIFDCTFRLEIDLSSSRRLTVSTKEKENGKLVRFSVVVIEQDSPAYASSQFD